MQVTKIRKLHTGSSGRVFRVNGLAVKSGRDAGLLLEILALAHLYKAYPHSSADLSAKHSADKSALELTNTCSYTNKDTPKDTTTNTNTSTATDAGGKRTAHPNIVHMVSYHVARTLVIVTEYAGRDLHDWLRMIPACAPTDLGSAFGLSLTANNTWPDDSVTRMHMAYTILPQLLAAVTYLHSCHMVHCDIKPANIAVCAHTGHTTLIDFGAIHYAGNCNEHASLEYVPYLGTQEILDPGAQMLWGVGAVVYTVLTGNSPKCIDRFDPDDPDDSESAEDYLDSSGKCTCVKCIDWNQYQDPIYTVVYNLIYGVTTLPKQLQPLAALPEKTADETYYRIGVATTSDTFYRAYYLYRQFCMLATPTENTWRVCCAISYAMWHGIGNKLFSEKRDWYHEFPHTITLLAPYLFVRLPDTDYIQEHGDMPDFAHIIAHWE